MKFDFLYLLYFFTIWLKQLNADYSMAMGIFELMDIILLKHSTLYLQENSFKVFEHLWVTHLAAPKRNKIFIVTAQLNLNSSWEWHSNWLDHPPPPLTLLRHFKANCNLSN